MPRAAEATLDLTRYTRAYLSGLSDANLQAARIDLVRWHMDRSAFTLPELAEWRRVGPLVKAERRARGLQPQAAERLNVDRVKPRCLVIDALNDQLKWGTVSDIGSGVAYSSCVWLRRTGTPDSSGVKVIDDGNHRVAFYDDFDLAGFRRGCTSGFMQRLAPLGTNIFDGSWHLLIWAFPTGVTAHDIELRIDTTDVTTSDDETDGTGSPSAIDNYMVAPGGGQSLVGNRLALYAVWSGLLSSGDKTALATAKPPDAFTPTNLVHYRDLDADGDAGGYGSGSKTESSTTFDDTDDPISTGQTISPTGISGSAGFQTNQLNLFVAHSALSGSGLLGSQTLVPGAVGVTPGVINGSGLLGSHQLDLYIAHTALSGSGLLGSHTLVPGAVTISPSALDGSGLLGSHTLTLFVPMGVLTGNGAFQTPTLVPGAVTITVPVVDGSGLLGSHTLTLYVAVTALDGSGTFQTPTLVPGAVTVSPTALAGSGLLGSPELLTGNFIAAGDLAGQGLLGSHTLVPGGVTIAHSPLAGSGLLGAHVLSPGAVTITPTGVQGSAAFQTHTVAPGAATVTAPTIAGTGDTQTPTLSPGAVQISPNAFAGLGLVQTPTITLYLALSPLAGSGLFGSHVVAVGAANISPTALAKLGLLIAPAMSGGLQFAGARLVTSEALVLRYSNEEEFAVRYVSDESLEVLS